MRYVLSRVFLILFGTLLALIIVEVFFRFSPPPNRFTMLRQLEQQWQTDEELLLRLKPNLDMHIHGHPEFDYTVRTNEDGMRDGSFEGTFDVAAIGDSFTYGFGVEEEESWPTRFEALSGLRVANLGWAGWNSHVYPTTIRRYAIPLQAKIWIWAFFGNDLVESTNAEAFLLSGETDYLTWNPDGKNSTRSLKFPWNIRTFEVIATLLNPDLLLLPDSGDGVFDDGKLQFRYGPYAWEVTDPSKPEVKRGWKLTEQALLEADELASDHNARLLVVFVPNREHVYWPYIEDVMVDYQIGQLDRVEQRLEAFCDDQGIQFLSLLPVFRSKALEGAMLYFPADGHFNVAGHDLTASIVLEALERHEIITP